MNLEIAHLFIYPIKSLAGIEVQSTQVDETGFRFDRAWMIIDEKGKPITQRDIPEMALMQPEIDEEIISLKNNQKSLNENEKKSKLGNKYVANNSVKK